MPKAGNSKKRKRERKKDEDQGVKKAKSKENDGQHKDPEDTSNVSNEPSNLPYEEQQEIDDIDEKLEQNAAKNNLTTINVKSILHHVVSDKRVLAMVKSVAAELEDEQDEAASGSNLENLDVELDFAPKMTRAKSKQTNQGDPIAVLASQSPIKELRTKRTSRKKKIHFTELELPESSSDEEYNPDQEEDGSDEDTESCVSFTSDLASPQFPGTPESKKTDDTKDSEDKTSDIQPEKTVTRSLSKKLLQEPFKVPYPVTSTTTTPADEITVVEEGDLIAKRTRSQLPLQDVPIESIEATFQPPDFTADMYDPVQEDDLDFEDIEWQKWLQGLINSDDICGEEDHEDSEYNFMAEANQKEEKEEYRNDRAVRIPQKEVNELLDELLKDYDDSEDALCLDDDSEDISYLELLNGRDAVEEKVQIFNTQQLERLTEQLQQHAQLLTQIFVMAREDESLSKEAQLSQDYVNELKGFQDRASNAQLIRGLGDGMVHASAFSFPGLEQAVEIVNSTFVPKRRTPSPRKCNTPKKDKPPVKTTRRSKTLTDDLLPPLSETNMQLMATNKSVFRFVEILPHHNLLPRTGDTPKQLNGLRVKFTDAEDNLLALGMKQHGKKWDLIQEHLLPVKSPKQLQIRCKNLLSARAPENIIKYYRRNKELWELPTRIQVYVESNGRRLRGRDSVEPDWLINYKKKQKERRESQEKSEALAVQQSIEGAAYGRPIVPKFTGGTYAVALPSVSSPGERGKVAWVAITSSTSPWKALTPPRPVEDVRKGEHALPTGNVTSARSSPAVSVCQDNVNQTSEDRAAPLHAATVAIETDVDANTNLSPANDEPVVQTQDPTEKETSIPTADDDSKSSSTSSNPKEISKENASKESTEKTTSESSTNKPATSSKAKSSRDKNGGNVTGDRVTSKSHVSGSETGGNASGTSRKPAPNSQAGWAGNYILEPDPKFRNRAHAFAEGFLAKVKKQLTDDPVTYEEFLRTLALSSAEQCSPVELYRRVEVVLAQYPSLVEDFVGFLEPHQAVEAGVFMANLEFVRARTFLRKLEVHFQRTPSQFRKIINVFDSWNKKTVKDPLQLQQTIVPMLKGQMHLIEEFYSFFDDLKPPVCSDDDFEEIDFGSGSEPEVDDFEEVVIPCFVEPKKIKGRPAKDTLQRNSNTRKTRKPSATVKGTKQQGTAGKPLGNRTKVGQTKANTKAGAKQDNPPGKNQGDDAAAKNLKRTPEMSASVETTGEESGVGDQRIEVNALEGPLSVTTSLQSETSNDSYRGEELNPTSQDTLNLEHEEERERRNTDSEEQEDDGNSDMEHDGYEEDDDDDYMDGDDIDGDVIKSDVDAEASGCDSDANVVSSSAVVPAKNLQRSQDGQVVLLWTREDDRVILQACQKMGAKQETFQHIANGLKDKTADEVKMRFMDLLNLFKASSGERTRESINEESCSEEEDEEDSETVGESEGEQPHD